MKIFVYQGQKEDKKFLLTEKEFIELMEIWAKGGIYYCKRLKVGLSKSYLKWFEEPSEDSGKQVFIRKFSYGGRSYTEKVYKKNEGKYWVNGSLGWHPIKLTAEEIKNLIPQEQFYENGGEL